VSDGVLEAGDKHGTGHPLDPRNVAWPDNFRRLANDAFSSLVENMKLRRLGLRRLQKLADPPRFEPNLRPEVQASR